jgi:dTDP-glucose 4,6-dehydratase
MRYSHILVTGGAGFIGSHFVRHILRQYPDCRVRVVDSLTYAGNLENLEDVAEEPRYSFVRADIRDAAAVNEAMADCDAVVHFAAETHVDRSILNAGDFIRTDVFGTFVMLEAARQHEVERFVHISTDEVYGEVLEGASKENDTLLPRSPYAASKAGADRMAYAFFATYGLPILITRGSNTYGPNQYPEKLIPFFAARALRDEPLPVYGDGRQVRDWLYVLDHCRAIETVLLKGEPGEVYNVGGGCERQNIDVTRLILTALDKPESLIRFVKDRAGHDRRYALDCTKLHALGWRPEADFDRALPETVTWYRDHADWVERSLARGKAFFEEYYRDRA